MKQRKSARETHREKQRQTDRQRETERNKERERETDRVTKKVCVSRRNRNKFLFPWEQAPPTHYDVKNLSFGQSLKRSAVIDGLKRIEKESERGGRERERRESAI